MKNEFDFSPTTLGRDLLSGIIVFLVALPLCLGIAIASDAAPIAGLISGIVGGIVIGLCSGSHTSVSGPAAGLSAVVAAQIAGLGKYETFLLAVVLGGVIQLGFGILKAGALSAFFPSSVIKGLLAAIGVILIFKQFPVLFGHTKDMGLPFGHAEAGTVGQMQQLPHPPADHAHHVGDIIVSFFKALRQLFTYEGGFQWGAILIGLFSLVFLITWDQIKPLKKSLVPAPLLVVFISAMLGRLLSRWDGSWSLSAKQLVDVPTAGNFQEFKAFIKTPDFSQLTNPSVYIAGITIAVVASLETLLNLDAVDKLDKKQRISPPNRELFAQGAGNIVAGLLGGIPVTSVVIRGSVNVNAGAQTKLSAIFHGILLVGCVALIPHWLKMIPLSCLAAILLLTGYKLANPALFRQMWNEGRYQFMPFILTLVAIVLTDLLVGICIGLVLSLLFILNSNLRRPIRRIHEKHIEGEVLHIELANQVSFLNRAALESALREAPRGGRILLDARRTDYIDPDVLSLIREFRDKTAPAYDIQMQLVGFREKYKFKGAEDTVDFSPQDARDKLTPPHVIAILTEGNKRFAEGHPLDRDLRFRVVNGVPVRPIAALMTGIDPQTPVEMIFDLGPGDAYVIRMPGAVLGPRALGGAEFAVSVGGVKLIVVMGHTDSSLLSLAIRNACSPENKAEQAGCAHLEEVLNEIAVSLDTVEARKFPDMAETEQHEFMSRLARKHVQRTVSQITERSSAIRTLTSEGKLAVVAALYDVETGTVEFLK